MENKDEQMTEGYEYWLAVRAASQEGTLHELLNAIPESRWISDNNPNSHWTYLHYATNAQDMTAIAALINAGANVDALSATGQTPLEWAAFLNRPRALKMLCAAGASHRATSLSSAIYNGRRECAHILIANGTRLAGKCSDFYRILERSVLQCRSVAIALLTLKRRKRREWSHVDRFLLREMALAVWSTRMEDEWQATLLAPFVVAARGPDGE